MPTYRHEALPGYQAGRVFDDAILDAARGAARRSSSRSGSSSAKADGYEADDFLAAAAARWPGRGRRRHVRPRRLPARQRPRVGAPAGQGRERARASRAGRGARALRRRPDAGAGLHRAARRSLGPHPRRARRRTEDGGRGARPVRHARGGARRRPLLDDRRRPAPVPPCRPDGRRGAAPRARSARRRTGSAARRRPASSASTRSRGGSPSTAERRPRSRSSAIRPSRRSTRRAATRSRRRRIEVLHERFSFTPCAPAAEEDVLRCHTPALVDASRTRRGWLDGDTICTETTYEAALLAAGAAIEAARRGGFALARPPGHHAEPGACDGLLHLRLDRDRRALGPGRARARPRGDPRLGRPPRQRDAGDRRRRPDDPLRLAPPVAVLPRHGRPGRAGRHAAQPPARRRHGRRGLPGGVRRRRRHAVAAFEPELLLVSAGFDAHVDDPLAQLELSTALFEELAGARARLAPRVAAVLEGGYNLATLPELVEAALESFGGVAAAPVQPPPDAVGSSPFGSSGARSWAVRTAFSCARIAARGRKRCLTSPATGGRQGATARRDSHANLTAGSRTEGSPAGVGGVSRWSPGCRAALERGK